MQRYRIGEVSKMVDVPVETIRFLEQKGLLTPEKNPEMDTGITASGM